VIVTKEKENGQEDPDGNIPKVEGWIAERNRLGDWNDYKYRGRIKRAAVVEDLGYAPSVNTQNPGVRKLLEDQDKIWFNFKEKDEGETQKDTIDAQAASIARTRGKLNTATSDYNEKVERVAELEAEVRDLEQQLNAYERLHRVIQAGDPGCKI